MTQQEQSQEQQQLHPNCTFVCLTEDVNNSETEPQHTSRPTTLDEAKEWIAENQSRDYYSCHNLAKIIVLDSNGEIEQIYTKKPEDFGVWKSWY